VIVATSGLPLLWTPKMPIAATQAGAFRAALPGVLFFLGDGFFAAGYVFVWQVALFLSLKQNVMAFGGALAIAAVVGAVGGLLLGRFIDSGNGRRAVFVSFGVLALIVALRAASIHDAALAVFANALGALGSCLYVPTLMTAVYTLAKRAPCTLRFHVATEAGWDTGGAAGLLAAAALIHFGAPIRTAILLSLIGVATGTILLVRYYRDNRIAPDFTQLLHEGALLTGDRSEP
jgi:MFS family permease